MLFSKSSKYTIERIAENQGQVVKSAIMLSQDQGEFVLFLFFCCCYFYFLSYSFDID